MGGNIDWTINIPLIVTLLLLLVSSVRQTTIFQEAVKHLKEDQKKHESQLDEHDKRLDDHDRRLDRHELLLQHINGEKNNG